MAKTKKKVPKERKVKTGRKSQKLTIKQKRFCDYYISLGNGAQAAIKAGYSKKTARQVANEILTKPYIQDYITIQNSKLEAKRFATLEEVQAFWSNVLRKEEEDDITLKDRLKASEFIAKTKGAFIDKVEHSGQVSPVTITLNIPDEVKKYLK